MKEQLADFHGTFASLSHSLDDQYVHLKSDLDKWHFQMIERIDEMFFSTLTELDTSYERLDTFRQTLGILLDDDPQDSSPVSNSERRTSADLMAISARLSWVENEIDSLSNVFYQLNCHEVQLIDRPCLLPSHRAIEFHSSSIPCRILLKREQIDHLSESINRAHYSLFVHPLSPEAILGTNNVQQLASLIEPVLLSSQELRVLVHEFYVPLIIGQLGSRARMLKEKYSLTNIQVERSSSLECGMWMMDFQIYPTCAPLSTERVLLLSGTPHQQILRCLTEIHFNLSQTPLLENNHQATFLYSPEFYDASLAEDYGGFVDRHAPLSLVRSVTVTSHLNDDEELSDFEDEEVEDFDHETNNNSIEPLRERHWTLSDAQAGALFGPNSSRLHQIRSESNAWIVIFEAQGKSSRRPMSIRGTKAEIEHATKLILETIKRHDRKLPVKHNHKRGK